MTRMTSKGQVTVPADVRYALGLNPGDEIVFAVEDGRGVLRRAVALSDLRAAFPGVGRAHAHPLECLLVGGDERFVASVEAARAAGRRLRVPDAVLLDIAAALVARGAPAAQVAAAMRDVLAERAVRSDFPGAVRAAIAALAGGRDPLRTYALARG
jgi:AbrB family looped-hinge helix DNA binding protein